MGWWWIFPVDVRLDSPTRGDPFLLPLYLLKHPFGRLALELGLGRFNRFSRVHQPRGTLNFHLVTLIGWYTRRQAMLWSKTWWWYVEG